MFNTSSGGRPDMRKLALVTGAAGFIGSHTVDLLLANGYRVRGLDDLSAGRLANLEQHRSNPDFEFEAWDVTGLQANDTFFQGVDHVFHFAGKGDIVPSVERPAEYMSVNVMGTVRVLE